MQNLDDPFSCQTKQHNTIIFKGILMKAKTFEDSRHFCFDAHYLVYYYWEWCV